MEQEAAAAEGSDTAGEGAGRLQPGKPGRPSNRRARKTPSGDSGDASTAERAARAAKPPLSNTALDVVMADPDMVEAASTEDLLMM